MDKTEALPMLQNSAILKIRIEFSLLTKRHSTQSALALCITQHAIEKITFLPPKL
jgi:hypothetical protein